MTQAAATNGFLSQRKFRRYMKEYKNQIKGVDERFEDVVSQEMVEAGREKGEMGEFVVKGILQDLGYEVSCRGGYDSCDLMVNTDKGWKRIEVKTASQGPKSRSNNYAFSGIKPWKFDMLAMVFVGEQGLTVKIGSGYNVKRFIEVFGSITDSGSYNICLDRYRGHTGLYGTNRMVELNAENMPSVISAS